MAATIKTMRIERPSDPVEEAALAWAKDSLIPDTTDHEVDSDSWIPANHGYDDDDEAAAALTAAFEAYGSDLAAMVKLLLNGEAVVLKTSDLEILRNAAVSIE